MSGKISQKLPTAAPPVAIDPNTQVRDAEILKGESDLVGYLGDINVGALRHLFEGRSLEAIRRLPQAHRAAIVAKQVGFSNFCNMGQIAMALGADFGFKPVRGGEIDGANFSGSERPMFTIGTLSYDDPSVTERLVKAFALDRGGEPQKAIAIYDDILADHPNNADALNRKALALKHRGELAIDIRSTSNESRQSLRHAVDDLESALSHFEQVVQLGVDAGVYDPDKNQLTLPSIKKFQGNEDVRHLFVAVAKALYNIGATRVVCDRIQGKQPYSDANLAALRTATTITTDLTDPDKAAELLRDSGRFTGQGALLHNMKLEGTLRDAASFAASISDTFRGGYAKDPDFRQVPAHSKSGDPRVDGDLRRDVGFRQAIGLDN